ncbi:MAG TPA: NADP(H)-dependent aldo-keto reductase [Burkholderiales bacterium]|nr:NADP(H)-dependent aldo-keto reductase [Burkholderiales bacterium]
MKYNKLGDGALQVSEVCLGTMTWGEQNDERQAHEQLDYAVSRGVNFVDAAEMYPVPPRVETQGRTESILGNWLKKQRRDKLVVATKVTGPGRGFHWIRGGELAINRKNVFAAVEGSLRRLQTDCIDLYQIHWPDRYVPSFGKLFYDPAEERPTVPIAEQLGVFAELIKAGKIRAFGLSNESAWGTMQWLRAAEGAGLPKPVSIQNAYNLINRSFEPALSEVTRREGIPLLAYSPLAFGHLAGKYLGGAKPAGARLTLFPPFGQRYIKPNVEPAVTAYAALARKRGLSPATLAIAFCRSRWFCASTIVGATSLAQLKEDIDAAAVDLAPDLLAEIDDIHLRFSNPAV